MPRRRTTAALVANRYRIEPGSTELAPGVWRAHDGSLPRDVAVVEFADPSDGGPRAGEEWRRRAQERARQATELRHPDVIAVLEVAVVDDGLAVVSEVPQGPTLAELVERDGPFAAERVVELGAALARGLAGLHAAGLDHGALHPGAVVVGPGGGRLWLALGLGRGAGAPAELARDAAAFAPPGEGGDPAAADLWSLGAVLRFALSGRSEAPLPPGTPSPLVAVVGRLLSADPGRRGGADEVARELAARDLAGPPPETPEPAATAGSQPKRRWRPGRRRPGPEGTAPDPGFLPDPGSFRDPLDDDDAPAGPAGGSPAASAGGTRAWGDVVAWEPAADPAPPEPAAPMPAAPMPAPPEAAPSEPAAPEAAPSDAAPSDAAPSEAAPSEAAPSDAAPSEAAPPEAVAGTPPPPAEAVPTGTPAGAGEEQAGHDRNGSGNGSGDADASDLPLVSPRVVPWVPSAGLWGMGPMREKSDPLPAPAAEEEDEGRSYRTTFSWPPPRGVRIGAGLVILPVILVLIALLLTNGAVGRQSDREEAKPGVETPVPSVPSHWIAYRDPDLNFGISYPPGWRLRETGAATVIADPETGALLRVDYVSPPGPSPVAAARAREPNVKQSTGSYRQLQLTPITFMNMPGAIWEFSFTSNSNAYHAVNLGLDTGRYLFHLYFESPEVEWERMLEIFNGFAGSFRPPA